MNSEFMVALIKEGVSLAILLFVLFGVYKLTNRMIDIISVQIDRCCESLERIADAQEYRKSE